MCHHTTFVGVGQQSIKTLNVTAASIMKSIQCWYCFVPLRLFYVGKNGEAPQRLTVRQRDMRGWFQISGSYLHPDWTFLTPPREPPNTWHRQSYPKNDELLNGEKRTTKKKNFVQRGGYVSRKRRVVWIRFRRNLILNGIDGYTGTLPWKCSLNKQEIYKCF